MVYSIFKNHRLLKILYIIGVNEHDYPTYHTKLMLWPRVIFIWHEANEPRA
ncbi:hypothetical protein T23_04890 [Turicibacter faecis]|uniref:Uncharacterized protein n=1 Tax=Turicibacter faecis TaxID=2963365 RepID=A0ABN6ZG79_9FIRM|nr:hypothetical protein T23_04890 [Turicibacter sp. TC023]